MRMNGLCGMMVFVKIYKSKPLLLSLGRTKNLLLGERMRVHV